MRRLFLIFGLLFAGCSITAQPASSGITFPMLPAWRAVTASPLDQVQVLQEIKRLAPSAVVMVSDSRFTLLDYDFAVELIDWASKCLRVQGEAGKYRYDPEGFDCDKYAKAFTLLCEIAAGRAGAHAQPLAARIFVSQQVSWGNVSAGGAHAIVAIATTRGILVVEPQSTRLGGMYCFLSEYPNRAYIWRVTIGG